VFLLQVVRNTKMRAVLINGRYLVQLARLAHIFVVVACMSAVWFAATSPEWTFDQYWHLQSGRDLIEGIGSAYNDSYSYTFLGEPIALQPYLFQMMYAWFEANSDYETASVWIRVFSGFLILVSAGFFLYKTQTENAARFLVLVLLTFYVVGRLPARPESFDYILITFGFYLAERTRRDFSVVNLVWCALLLLAWVNFHAGILAYVIFAIPFVDRLASLIQGTEFSPRMKDVLAWGVIFVCIGFLNQDLQNPILQALQFSEVWQGIGEHRPSIDSAELRNLLIIFWTCALIVIVWAVLSRNYGIAATAIIFTYASIDRLRMVHFAGFSISYCFLLLSADPKARALGLNVRPGIYRLINGILWFGVAGVLCVMLAGNLSTVHAQTKPPRDVAHYLRENYERGKILNEYRWGGFLIYELHPAFSVFIDGRTEILYPPEFFSEYRSLMAPDESLLEKLRTSYRPDFAIFSPSQAPHNTLVNKLNMEVEFIGDEHFLYTKSGVLTRLATLLKYPTCVESEDFEMLASLATNSPVSRLPKSMSLGLQLMLPLVLNENNDGSLKYQAGTSYYSVPDQTLRLVAHAYMIAHRYVDAAKIWNLIKNPLNRDLIYAAFNSLKAEQFDDAQSTLELVISEPWREARPLTTAQIFRIDILVAMLSSSKPASRIDLPAELRAVVNEQSLGSSGINPDQFVYISHCEFWNLPKPLIEK